MAKDPHKEELIKQYNHSRAFIRKFYVYGFMHKEEFHKKNRTYDDEKRRIGNWLEPYMRFEQDHHKKYHFIAVDSRDILENPLYKTLKTSTFTDGNLLLHFLLLDILSGNPQGLTHIEIMDLLADREYVEISDSSVNRMLDDAFTREHGILTRTKVGKQHIYKLNEDSISLEQWQDAVLFFTEAAPLGIVGSFISDRHQKRKSFFRFKRHFIFDALDSEILEQILTAIDANRQIEIVKIAKEGGTGVKVVVLPLKIFISTQNGRQYLLGYSEKMQRCYFNRIDLIDRIKILKNSTCSAERKKELTEKVDRFRNHIWGTSTRSGRETEHLEMTIYAGENEAFIVRRLKQEKRNGSLEQLDAHHWRFMIDVYDAGELLPWIRSFIGRITDLSCSNEAVTEKFNADLKKTIELYKEGTNDFQ